VSKSTATLTIRDVPLPVIRALKAQARRNDRSMEQEARDMLVAQLGGRAALLQEIRESWQWQTRQVTAPEIEAAILIGRN
jgi:hypothetical protein